LCVHHEEESFFSTQIKHSLLLIRQLIERVYTLDTFVVVGKIYGCENIWLILPFHVSKRCRSRILETTKQWFFVFTFNILLIVFVSEKQVSARCRIFIINNNIYCCEFPMFVLLHFIHYRFRNNKNDTSMLLSFENEIKGRRNKINNGN
jgi:hypothetical protein